MSSVTTVVSVDTALLDQAEALAREFGVSRSRLFTLALEEFVRRHRNRQLLERISAAYADAVGPADAARLRAMRAQHRRVVDGEW